jgi:hypothetical protein
MCARQQIEHLLYLQCVVTQTSQVALQRCAFNFFFVAIIFLHKHLSVIVHIICNARLMSCLNVFSCEVDFERNIMKDCQKLPKGVDYEVYF